MKLSGLFARSKMKIQGLALTPLFMLAMVDICQAASTKPAPLPLMGVSAAGAIGVAVCGKILRWRRK